MKKISLLLVLLLVLSLGLVGCGNGNQDPVEEDPVEEDPVEEDPVEEEPAEEEPVEEEPAEEEPAEEEPAEEEPVEEEPAEEEPAEEEPAEEEPTEEEPAEEEPIEEEQTEEEPADEEPAEEEPADEEPAEEEPTEEEPAEEEANESSDDNVFANVNPESPIIVTSYGQSSDGAMVKALLGKAGVTHDYKQIIESSELSGYNTIVIAPGASSKGLGSAGISPEEEVERVQEITDSISSSTKVIVVHIGGENRRGELSDQMIDIALAKADAIIVVESGDADGIFSNFASTNNIPIEVVPTMNDTVDSFENLFN